jgi:hypothetical protein
MQTIAPETPQTAAAPPHHPSFALYAGRDQALTEIAASCLAAKIQTFKEARKSVRLAGGDWDRFCPEEFGYSRSQVNRYIFIYDHFGLAVLQLFLIGHITTPEFQRLCLARYISGDRFEFNGQSVEISPANGYFIRAALREIRAQQEDKPSRAALAAPPPPGPCPPDPGPQLDPPPDPPTPDDIHNLLDTLYRSLDLGYKPAYRHLLAPGAIFLGPGIGDRLLLAETHFIKWNYQPQARSVAFSPDGNTAWFDETLFNPDKPDGPIDRISGVLIRIRGEWKIAQIHLAFLRRK